MVPSESVFTGGHTGPSGGQTGVERGERRTLAHLFVTSVATS